MRQKKGASTTERVALCLQRAKNQASKIILIFLLSRSAPTEKRREKRYEKEISDCAGHFFFTLSVVRNRQTKLDNNKKIKILFFVPKKLKLDFDLCVTTSIQINKP